jgi:hypothetical protein
VDQFPSDRVLDYAIVYGNDIDSLTIQTYVVANGSKMTTLSLIATLVDTMAAFCRLKSAFELHTIPYFKGLFLPSILLILIICCCH